MPEPTTTAASGLLGWLAQNAVEILTAIFGGIAFMFRFVFTRYSALNARINTVEDALKMGNVELATKVDVQQAVSQMEMSLTKQVAAVNRRLDELLMRMVK